MTTVAIPNWNAQGVLPPVNHESLTSSDRSPYTVSLLDFVLRFATSPERRMILDGFLRYRAALHEVGFDSGFQWIDGSFLERVEQFEDRPPGDVDVVTFFEPVSFTPEQVQRAGALLQSHLTKPQFHVDAYGVTLDARHSSYLVRQSTYWYSVWSHRRCGTWKGYIQIDLSAQQDADATALLAKVNKGGTP